MSATHIYITIPVVKMTNYSITRAEANLIRHISTPGSARLFAIKFIREQYDLGLKEAMDVCEAVLKAPPHQHEILGELDH